MTVETEVANLTTAVDSLTAAVNVSKATLDASVADAQTHKTGAQAAQTGSEAARDQAGTHAANVAAAIAAAEAVTAQDVSGGTEARTFTEVCQPILGNLADLGPEYILFRMGEHRRPYYRERVAGDALYTGALGNDLGELANEAAARAVSGATTNDFYHNTTDGKFYKLNATSGQTEIIRGPKAEFPQSYEIRSETDRIIIIDAQTGSMWATILVQNGNFMIRNFGTKAVYFIGGCLYVATETAYSSITFFEVDFVSGEVHGFNAGNRYKYQGDFSTRQDGVSSYALTTGSGLVSNLVNAVAATILPDAPATRANGMREITWAVGTDGGVSVCKNGGAVYDITNSTDPTYQVVATIAFTDANEIIFGMDSHAGGRSIRVHDIPASDINIGTQWYNKGTSKRIYQGYTVAVAPDLHILGENSTAKKHVLNGVVASNLGISRLWENPNDPASGMVAYQAEDYVTPVMYGDVKGAWFNEWGQAGTLIEAILNNTSNYVDEWYTAAPNSWTVNATSLVCTGAASPEFVQINTSSDLGILQGEQVGLRFTVSSYTSGTLYTSFATGAIDSPAINGTGTYEIVGTITRNQYLYLRGENFVGTLTNVECFSVSPDRSVNGKGLILNGSLTQDAEGWVSGFSAANYAEQPYNADLDFGTGDFYVAGWINTTDATAPLVARNNGVNYSIIIGTYSAGQVWFYTKDTSTTGVIAACAPATSGEDVLLVGVRRNGTLELWANGRLLATQAGTIRDVNLASALLSIGHDPSGNGGTATADTRVRRVCIGAGAPSHAQIKVMAAWDGMGLAGTFKDQFFDETSGDLLVLTSTHLHRVDPNGRVTSEVATADFVAQYFNREALA